MGCRSGESSRVFEARIRAYFKENAAKIAHTPVETQVAGDWAFERGNLTVTVTPKSGKPIEESIKYRVIVKRQPDGTWKVHSDISNSNLKSPHKA